MIDRVLNKTRDLPVNQDAHDAPQASEPPRDREAALRWTGDNAAVADSLWGLFMEQLPGHRQRLYEAFARADRIKLREEVHVLLGSASCCGAPILKRSIETLQRSLHADHSAELELPMGDVLAAIDQLLELDREQTNVMNGA